METQFEGNPKSNPSEAETHIRSAHQILKALQEKLGKPSRNRRGHHKTGDGAE